MGKDSLRPSKYSLIVALVAIITYLPTLFFDFAYDDYHQIHNHGLLTSPLLSISTLLFPFFEPTFPGDLFRPITVFSYRLNFLVTGLVPWSFHLVNLLLHGFCSYLLYILIRDLLRNEKIALVSALIFAIHPIHIEAVANVVGRAELLAATLGMSAMWLFRKACLEENRTKQLSLFGWAAFNFLLAILSKESAMSLLLLIPLYALVSVETGPANRRKLRIRALKGLLIFLGFSIVYIIYRWVILQDLFLPDHSSSAFLVENPLLTEPFVARLFPGLKILGDYIRLLVLPLGLSADYSLTQSNFWGDVYSLKGVISVLLTLSVLWSIWWHRGRRFAFFGLWFFLSFILTLNILFPIGTIMGERLAYLPSAGFITFFVALIAHYAKAMDWSSANLRILALLLALLYLGLFSLRLPDWRSSNAIFKATLLDNPRSPKALINYGLHLYTKEKRYAESEPYFRAAIEADPDRVFAYHYLVHSLLFQDKLAEAEFWARRALELAPDDPGLLVTLEKIQSVRSEMQDLLVDPTKSNSRTTASPAN